MLLLFCFSVLCVLACTGEGTDGTRGTIAAQTRAQTQMPFNANSVCPLAYAAAFAIVLVTYMEDVLTKIKIKTDYRWRGDKLH